MSDRRRWTAEEVEYLRRHVGRRTYREIGEALGRTPKSCDQAAFSRGLAARRGTDAWRERIARSNRGRHLHPAGEFKPGHVPWMKGRRGIHQSPATEFKRGGPLRGTAARRFRAIGTVVTRTRRAKHRRHGERVRFIKVRDSGPFADRYISLARWLWEHQRGPIPPGMVVIHADGDSLNDDLANLRLVDRRGLLAWQQSTWPAIKVKARRRLNKVLRRRSIDYRRLKAWRLARQVSPAREVG